MCPQLLEKGGGIRARYTSSVIAAREWNLMQPGNDVNAGKKKTSTC